MKLVVFDRLASQTERIVGHPLAFAGASLTLLIWLVSGPVFGFSDTWQLVINTFTTIVTFLMVFLIQNTQNRAMAGLQLKLDEIVRSIDGANNAMLKAEEMTLEELERFAAQYKACAENARAKIKIGQTDTGTPTLTPI